jgi:hypothetical protein
VGVVSELIKGDVFFWGALMVGALFGSVPVAVRVLILCGTLRLRDCRCCKRVVRSCIVQLTNHPHAFIQFYSNHPIENNVL